MHAKIIVSILATVSIVLGIYFWQQIIETWMRFSVRNENIVVTLTTTPYRINNLKANLDSIFKQNATIQNIYISIPHKFQRDNLDYIIPEWLAKDDRITILRSKDYGPATKLVGALEKIKFVPNTIIITIDDDVIYPKNLVLHLAYFAKANPNSAVGVMGAVPIYDKEQKISLDSEYGLKRISQANASVHILQGWASVAYRARFFDRTIFEIENTIPECRNSDDVYLSFYLARHNISRIVLRNKYLDPQRINKETIAANSEDALFKQEPRPVIKHRACFAYLHQQYPDVDF
jgi:hypothetical protein